MLASTVFFSGMHGTVRVLSNDIHPFEVAFFRNLFGIVAIAPWVFKYGFSFLRTSRIGLHAGRAGLNVFAMLAFFMALSLSPLALVQALGFTAPLFTTVLAIFLLGEKVRARRWAALAIGFVGVIVILRPGSQPLELGALLSVGSAAVWGLCLIMIKQLARTDSALTITAYMVLFMTPLSFIAAAFVWVWPTPEQLVWLFACGLLGTFGQWMMAQSFRYADATVVLPLDFGKIIWGAMIGYFFFGESIDGWTWLGAVIIFAGGLYITLRERQLERERALA